MKVLESEAKQLLKAIGIAVPRAIVATTAQEAANAAASLGGAVVVKAQVPSGRRMKAGGILFAQDANEAGAAASRLLGSELLGFVVDHVLVEERLEIIEEVFLAAAYDARERESILLASSAGGIHVEASEQVIRRPFSVKQPLPEYVGREIAEQLGFHGTHLVSLAAIVTGLVQAFLQWDALLLELNPVALDSQSRWQAVDVHLEVDDDAAFRQQDVFPKIPRSIHALEQRSEFERRAAEIDSADHRGVAGRLIPFDGSLGLLIGGGGASLTSMDAILSAGLRPANYCEIGGNPSVWKVKELTKLILSQPQVDRLAVIMNVVSNTRTDLVARGVIKGVLELGREPRDVIVAFRVPGSWESEGREILRYYGITFYGREATIDDVVEAIRCRS